MTIQRKRRRIRFFRISLRTLSVVMLLCGLACGWVGMKRQQSLRQITAVTALVELRDSTLNRAILTAIDDWFSRPNKYEDRYQSKHPVVTFDSGPLGNRQPKGQFFPEWLRWITGEECFHRVIAVHLVGCDISDTHLTYLQQFADLEALNLDGTNIDDEDVKLLTELDLKQLCLGGTHITDRGLSHLQSFARLEELELWYNDLTDDGIVKLAPLQQLRRLNLCNTNVTHGGVTKLQRILPRCKIWWDGQETFRLINESPRAAGKAPNPANLVRAVNHLQSIGKRDAVVALEEYAEVAPRQEWDGLSPYDQTRLYLLLPMLFQRRNSSDGIPYSHSPLSEAGVICYPEWPHAHVTLQEDIPFHDETVAGTIGMYSPDVRFLVQWATASCDFRSEPLRPDNEAFVAASELCKRLYEERVGEVEWMLEKHLREQAERMMRHLDLDDPANAKLRWSDERQEYVLAEAPRE